MTMEITDHPAGLQLYGPFDPSDAPRLLAAIQESDVAKLVCTGLSSEDGPALAALLRGGIQPWLEQEDRRLDLLVTGSEETWDGGAARKRPLTCCGYYPT
jgi:hypothetical protein